MYAPFPNGTTKKAKTQARVVAIVKTAMILMNTVKRQSMKMGGLFSQRG